MVSNYWEGVGRLQNGGGGRQLKYYPYRKWGQKRFSHAEGGGGTTSCGVVLTRELEVLAKLIRGGGGHKGVHPLKGGGGAKGLPCLDGAQQVLDTQFYHFVAPPSP